MGIWGCWAAWRSFHYPPSVRRLRGVQGALLKHSVQVDSATEEVEVEGEEHQEVAVPLEEAAVEVQEEEASSVRKEAQRPLSYVYRLSPRR